MNDYYIFKGGRVKRTQNTIQIISADDEKKSIPVMNVRALHVFGQCDFNSALIIFLNTKGIVIHFYNYYGNYAGSYYPREKLLSGLVTVRQVQHYLNQQKRMYLASEFIRAATHNMLANLRYHKSKKKDVSVHIEKIQQLQRQIPSCSKVDELMGIEGNCRNIYYDLFDSFLRDDFKMEKRTRMPPQNMLNSLISFGNSMMYGSAVTEIYHSQLDPTVSYLHEPGYRRFSLSLDIAEVFKPVIVDKAIFKIVNSRLLDSGDFDDSMNGCYLGESGRKTFVKEYDERLDSTVYVSAEKKCELQATVEDGMPQDSQAHCGGCTLCRIQTEIMYCIVTYDIGTERIDAVRITIKQYLNWIQNSVFEGDISVSNLAELKSRISGLIRDGEDSVLVFTVNNPAWIKKEVVGIDKNNLDNMI